MAISLKPDLGPVAVRALQRRVGTVAGVILGVAALKTGLAGVALVGFLAALAAALPWARQLAYAALVLAMTPIVLVLLDLIGPVSSLSVYGDPRIVDTFVGAGIVLVFGYYLWPHARRRDFAALFGDAMDGVAAFLESVPSGDADRAVEARHRAFRKLGQLHATLRQSLAEPPPVGREAFAGLRIIAAAERLCDGVGALRAASVAEDPGVTTERITELADRIRSVGAEGVFPAPPTTDGVLPQFCRDLEDEIARLSELVRSGGPAGTGDPDR